MQKNDGLTPSFFRPFYIERENRRVSPLPTRPQMDEIFSEWESERTDPDAEDSAWA